MKYNELFRQFPINTIVSKIDQEEMDPSDPFGAAASNFSILNCRYHPFCSNLSYENSIDVRNKSFPSKNLPLNSIPFGIKDIFNTQVMPTTMGSPIWDGFVAGNNARCVDSLLRKGALSFGKTITAEFAVHALNETLNPYDVSKTPGTSSSGSAVAVSLGIVPFALGTQTAGSIIRPASFCGVWGFKPTFGLIPRTGVLKTTDSLDTVGFFSFFGSDLRRILSSVRVSGRNYPSVFRKIDQRGPTPKSKDSTWKIGVLYSSFWFNTDADIKHCFNSIVDLISNDATFDVQFIDDSLLDGIHDSHSIIYEKSLSYYFAEEYRECDKVSEVMLDMIEKGKKISSDQFLEQLSVQSNKTQGLNHQFSNYDAILTISTASSAPDRNILEKDDPSLAFTYLGMPSLHIPVGLDSDGMPIGFQISSAKYNDYLILQLLDVFLKKGIVKDYSIKKPIKEVSSGG